jgi:hypothetical protein
MSRAKLKVWLASAEDWTSRRLTVRVTSKGEWLATLELTTHGDHGYSDTRTVATGLSGLGGALNDAIAKLVIP